MSDSLPGVRAAALEWLALAAAAVLILAVTCWGSGRHSQRTTIDAYADTAREAKLSADSALHVARAESLYAAAQHAIAQAALGRADSLGRVAASLHARVRATDPTHVAVTRGDTTILYAVPPEIPARFAADSVAYFAVVAAYWSQHRELDVVQTENKALWKAARDDSIAFHAQAVALAAWPTEASRQRWQGRREGALLTVAVIAAAKLVTLVLR